MEKIQLNFTSYTLYVGNHSMTDFSLWDGYGSSIILKAEVMSKVFTPKDIEWRISDTDLASICVDSNFDAIVEARRTGFIMVTAKLPNGISATTAISILDNEARLTVQKLDFNTNELVLGLNQSAQLYPIFYPKDIYQNGMLDTRLEWISSNPSIVEVKDGMCRGLGIGEAIITARSLDVGRMAQCSVWVKQESYTTKEEQSIDLTMYMGEVIQFPFEKDFIYKSENQYLLDFENQMLKAYGITKRIDVDSTGYEIKEVPNSVLLYKTHLYGGGIQKIFVHIKDNECQTAKLITSKEEICLEENEEQTLTIGVEPAYILNPEIEYEYDADKLCIEGIPTRYGMLKLKLKGKMSGTSSLLLRYKNQVKTIQIHIGRKNSIYLPKEFEIMVEESRPLLEYPNALGVFLISDRNLVRIVDGNITGVQVGECKVYACRTSLLTEKQRKNLESLKETQASIEEILGNVSYQICHIKVTDEPYLREPHLVPESLTEHSALIVWKRVSLLDVPADLQYKIYVDSVFYDITTKLGYRVKDLKPNTKYTIRIDAVSKVFFVLASKTIHFTTPSLRPVLNVLDFAARGDGKHLDTLAIQQAIDACPIGGTVVLPKGYIFASGALFLKSYMCFQVDGILIGSIHPADYPLVVSRWEGWLKVEEKNWSNASFELQKNHYARSSLLNIGVYDEGENGQIGPFHTSHITICGEGQINGNGFILGYNEGPNKTVVSKVPYPIRDQSLRGRTLMIQNAEHIYVYDVVISYSPSWNVHAVFSRNITFDHVSVISQGNGEMGTGPRTDIKSSGHVPNGDGIDPESCTYVTIFDCFFRTGDDAVAMKSGRNKEGNDLRKPNAYIRITDCQSNWSIGGFGTGSENAGGAHDILIQNIKAEDLRIYGVWLKTNEARGGLTEHIIIRDMECIRTKALVHMNHTYGSSMVNPAEESCRLRDVCIENVKGQFNTNTLLFEGIPNSYIENVYIRGIESFDSGHSKLSYCKNFYLEDASSKFEIKNCEEIKEEFNDGN